MMVLLILAEFTTPSLPQGPTALLPRPRATATRCRDLPRDERAVFTRGSNTSCGFTQEGNLREVRASQIPGADCLSSANSFTPCPPRKLPSGKKDSYFFTLSHE